MNLVESIDAMEPHKRVMVAGRRTLRFGGAATKRLAEIAAQEAEIERLARGAEVREREAAMGIVDGRDDALSTEIVRAIQRAPWSKVERLMRFVAGM